MMTTTRKVHLDLEEDVKDLLDLVSQCSKDSTTTTKITLEFWGNEALDEAQVLRPVLASLGHVMSLRQLQMMLGDSDDVVLPVQLLTTLLQDCPQLECLCLDSIRLVAASRSEWEDLAEATRRHASLSCASMTMLEAQMPFDEDNDDQEHDGQSITTTSLLDLFWTALADLPTMRVLELDDTPISGLSLTYLCQSPNLHELELWNLPEVNEHVQDMARALNDNTTLKRLDMSSCNLNAAAGHALCDMLANDNTSLQVFVAEIEWDCMFARPVARVLQHNATLQHFQLVCRTSSNCRTMQQESCSAEAYAAAICHGLQHNSTLKCLSLDIQQSKRFRNDNSRLQNAFAAPLAHVLTSMNLTLEQFRLKGGRNPNHVTWSPEIQHYLRMNQAGRAMWLQGLLGDANQHKVNSNNDWIEAFLETNQHEDLSTIFYLLSVHPPICQTLAVLEYVTLHTRIDERIIA